MSYLKKDRVLSAAITSNLVMFSTGALNTWSSPVSVKLGKDSDSPFGGAISSEEISWVVSLLSIGAIFGPYIFGFAADKLGRKIGLIFLGITMTFTFLLMGLVQYVEAYYVARFVGGLCMGGSYHLKPMYIGEISPTASRGKLIAVDLAMALTGSVFSLCVGPYVSIPVFNLILAVFPIMFLILFPFLGEESPHYYLNKNNYSKTESTLRKLRTGVSEEEIKMEIHEIQEKHSEEKESIFVMLKSKALRNAVVIYIGMMAFQQLAGVTAVTSYAQTIFENAEVDFPAEINSIILMLVGALSMTSFSFFAEKLNRKTFYYISGVGVTLSLFALGTYFYLKDENVDVGVISFLPLLSLLCYTSFFNYGLTPMPWIYLGETFPLKSKSSVMSLASCISWILSFLVSKYFTTLFELLGMGITFWLFAVGAALSIFFNMFFVIETKGKSLEEIQEILGK